MTDNDVKIITNTITRLLASREHSRNELIRKLQQKGFEPQVCYEQIDKFSEQNIQSDSRFAEMLIRSRAKKGYGESRVRNELKEHSIDSDVIAQAMLESEVDWFELAAQVLSRKYGEAPPKDWKEQQKRQRFMQYRGFNLEQIKYATANNDHYD